MLVKKTEEFRLPTELFDGFTTLFRGSTRFHIFFFEGSVISCHLIRTPHFKQAKYGLIVETRIASIDRLFPGLADSI